VCCGVRTLTTALLYREVGSESWSGNADSGKYMGEECIVEWECEMTNKSWSYREAVEWEH